MKTPSTTIIQHAQHSAIAVFLLLCSLIAAESRPQAQARELPPVALYKGATSLDDIGIYGVSYRYDSGKTGEMPIGWSGGFEANSGISLIATVPQAGKSAFIEHPVWRGGPGDVDQTFRLALPVASRIELSFSIAMRSDVVGKSDGATFRVFVDDLKIADANKTDDAWSDYRYDLTRYAGKTITLVFETDPGPARNAGFDFALWGDRTITVDGAPERPAQSRLHPFPGNLSGARQGWGSTSPTHLAGTSNAAVISTNCAQAPADILSGIWVRIAGNGAAVPQSTLLAANGGCLDLVDASGAIVPSSSPDAHAVVTQRDLGASSVERIATYTLGERKITVRAVIDSYDGSSIRVRLTSPDPYIARVQTGVTGPFPVRRSVITPYYGQVWYWPDRGVFANASIDFMLSHASALTNDAALYSPLTDGRRIPLDETLYYAISPDVRDVFPTPPHAASPYRQTMGNVAVIDNWDSRLDANEAYLTSLASYDMTHFYTIFHVWQHGGYDCELPDVMPARSGNEPLKHLIDTAKGFGELFALHENYVDFYPNAPSYNKDDVALASDGKMRNAWMKSKVPSFLMAPVAMMKYAKQITPVVHQVLGTNASYLDVHSSIDPFVHTDMRADRPGAGMFITCVNAQRDLWQLMRDVHAGPVTGEGNRHWWWSGMLDGVEAQFGTGVPDHTGEFAPLFVDFDLLKIHPKQLNHGMGYIHRWMGETPPTQSQLDAYRMQELIFGHSAFIDRTEKLPWIFEEHNLAIPVASRYAVSSVSSIDYELDGTMADANEIVAAGAPFDRVRVRYANGLTIWANARTQPWTVTANSQSFELPQYGWVATAPTLTAYTATLAGRTVTYCRTPETLFASARPPVTESLTPLDKPYAAPRVVSIARTGARTLQIQFAFDALRQLDPSSSVFVHVVSPKETEKEGIVSQFSSGISIKPGQWTVGQRQTGSVVQATLPASLPDGVYEIRVGITAAAPGGRMPLDGNNDGARRYRVASVRIAGDALSVAPIEPAATSDQFPPIVNFGDIAANGSVALRRLSDGVWKLTPLPRTSPFTAKLRGASIDKALASIDATPIDADGRALGQPETLPCTNGVSTLTVKLPGGAVAYRLCASK
ncbi:MAG: hypothetical protein P4L33_03755 [Capsulimonadaceae bacterium]|nr:hypothetical protein [Capsulimonadaceae bacterium]